MENKEKQMTGEESLRIITEMINKTKVGIRQGSFHLLFWGWLIFGCSLTEYLLWKLTDYTHPYYVWVLIIPGAFVSLIYGFIKGRSEKVHTYATTVYVSTWIAFLLAAIVLFVLMQDDMQSIPAFILTLAAVPTFISGVILKFPPLIAGGVAFWIFALISHFGGYDIAALSVPAAMLLGYLIPGYLLRRKSHESV